MARDLHRLIELKHLSVITRMPWPEAYGLSATSPAQNLTIQAETHLQHWS